MKKFIIPLLIVLISAGVGSAIAGVDTNLTIRVIRDPVQLKQKLNDNFSYLESGVGTGSVERLSTCVTNASLTVSRASITYSGVDGSTNTISVCTNVTITLQR